MRILASMEERVREVMRRDQVMERRLKKLHRDDDERRKWGLKLYGVDAWDSRLYDMVMLIDKLSVDVAVGVITDVVKKLGFQATEASRQLLDNRTDGRKN